MGVQSLVVKCKVLTVLSMKDMIDNEVDNSVQGQYVSVEGKKMIMENCFLAHR